MIETKALLIIIGVAVFVPTILIGLARWFYRKLEEIHLPMR